MIEEYPAASCRESPRLGYSANFYSLANPVATGNALAISVQKKPTTFIGGRSLIYESMAFL